MEWGEKMDIFIRITYILLNNDIFLCISLIIKYSRQKSEYNFYILLCFPNSLILTQNRQFILNVIRCHYIYYYLLLYLVIIIY